MCVCVCLYLCVCVCGCLFVSMSSCLWVSVCVCMYISQEGRNEDKKKRMQSITLTEALHSTKVQLNTDKILFTNTSSKPVPRCVNSVFPSIYSIPRL